MELYRQHPWGDDWQQAATIAVAAYNPHVRKQIRVEQVIPAVKRPRPKMSVEQIAREIHAASRSRKR